jgi:hypothetical protein
LDTTTILILIVPGLVLLSVPVILVLSWRQMRARRRQFQTYAAAHGFSYAATARLPAELRDHPFFRNSPQMNFRRKIKRVLHRQSGGIETLVFDYWWINSTIGAVPTCRTKRTTVVCLRRSAAAAWRVVPGHGFQYLEFDLLDRFIRESESETRAEQGGTKPKGA